MLHQRLLPRTHDPVEPARWVEVPSTNPDHSCYANHRMWSEPLSAGYAATLAAHDTEATEESTSLEDTQQLEEATVVIAAGQLSEWVHDDLRDETTQARS